MRRQPTSYNLQSYGAKALWLDSETTGVDKERDDLIEVAAIYEDALHPFGSNPLSAAGRETPYEETSTEFRCLLKPHNSANLDPKRIQGALDVNGITLEQLAAAPKSWTALQTFREWLERFVDPMEKRDKLLMVGYNVKFDEDFVRAWWRKSGAAFYGSLFWPWTFDVLQLVIHYLLRSRTTATTRPANLKLGTVADWLGLEAEGTLHEARTDIVLTQKVYVEINERLDALARGSYQESQFAQGPAEASCRDRDEGRESSDVGSGSERFPGAVPRGPRVW